jgi:hypothetical protein
MKFLFLLLTTFLQGYELSLCAIFRNEAPYLREWIEFHKIQGVEHFYLYNNNSTDHFLDVLRPFIDSHDVTLIDWPYTYERGKTRDWWAIQTSAYEDCIARFTRETVWIAVIDLDEFLFCPDGTDLRTFLDPYREYGALCVNWLMFGTSGVEDIPLGDTLIEHLICCAELSETRHRRGKSIVQPKYVVGCKDAHSFIFQEPFFSADVYGKKLRNALAFSQVSHDRIRINHYWTRTEKWFRENKIPSREDRRIYETADVSCRRRDLYNKSTDRAILRFVPLLREKLGLSSKTCG